MVVVQSLLQSHRMAFRYGIASDCWNCRGNRKGRFSNTVNFESNNTAGNRPRFEVNGFKVASKDNTELKVGRHMMNGTRKDLV